MARKRKSRQELGYLIPVKIKKEPGRFTYGWVKSLTPDNRGQLRIYYANGTISSREASTCIPEPQDFKSRYEIGARYTAIGSSGMTDGVKVTGILTEYDEGWYSIIERERTGIPCAVNSSTLKRVD